MSRTRQNIQKNNKSFNHVPLRHFFRNGILFYLELNLRIIYKLIFCKKYEIICSVDLDTLPACFVSSKITGRKIIFDAHEIFHELPELEGKPVKAKIWKYLSRILFNKIRYKYTVNKSLQARFKHQFAAGFEIIRNIPPLEEIHSMPQISARTLVYLGVVNKGRGVDLAIRSLDYLAGFSLIIIGDGDEMQAMKELALDLGLADRVQFMGYTMPDEIPGHLSRGSIGLNMLDGSSGNYRYSLANKFFDYVHACLPSINMDYYEYAELNKAFEVTELCSEFNVDNLVEAVRKLENPEIYEAMQQQCQKARLLWNWQSESSKLLQLFLELSRNAS